MVNMDILAPDWGPFRWAPKKQNGDFLENGSNIVSTVQQFMEMISPNNSA
jgi:hypothetical protein